MAFLQDSQCGCPKGKPLLSKTMVMAGSVEEDNAVDGVYLTFNVAFGVISPHHSILTTKLVRHRLGEQVTRLVHN